MYADRFLEDVAGMVLIEPGFSGQGTRLPHERKMIEHGYTRRAESALVRCAALARAEKLQPSNLEANGCMTPPSDATEAMMPYILHGMLRPSRYEAAHSQNVNFYSGDDLPSVPFQQEMDAHRSFDDLPLVVLIAKDWWPKPWRTPEEEEAAYLGMRKGQQALAARSTKGRWVLVPNSNHYIQQDAPEAVIKAIQEVLAAARGETTADP